SMHYSGQSAGCIDRFGKVADFRMEDPAGVGNGKKHNPWDRPLSTSLESKTRAMPPQHFVRWSELCCRIELQMPPGKTVEPESFGSMFCKGTRVDNDPEFLIGRPKTRVEQPVGIF
ncbi:MAG: hypothetical protein WCH43_14310, partial [Verrucomicrobiota bacterium]